MAEGWKKAMIGLKERVSLVFLLLILLVLTERILVLFRFGFEYASNDQTVLWLAARDYGQGIFHEPYFYGQDYNFMLESLIAAPFVRLGAKVYVVLPVITSILSLTPYFLLSWLSWKKGEKLSASLVLSVPLLLPVDYGILASFSGGFVTGAFFATLSIPAMRIRNEYIRFIVTGMTFGIAYITNPNSTILIIPLAVYFLLENYSNWKLYLFPAIGTIPFLYIEYLAKHFYLTHPAWAMHGIAPFALAFWPELLMEAFSRLDSLMRYLSPLFWNNGWMILVMMLIAGIFMLAKKQYKVAVATFAGIGFIIFSFGIGKVHDSIDSIFLSSTRMFMAVPVLFALVLTWMMNTKMNSSRAASIVLSLCIVSFTVKMFIIDRAIERHTSKEELGPIGMMSVHKLCVECEAMAEFARKQDATIIVGFMDQKATIPWLQFRTQACELLADDFPQTFIPIYDLRTWRYIEEEKNVHRNIIFLGGENYYWFPRHETKIDTGLVCYSHNPALHLLKNNKRPTIMLLQEMKADIHTYK